MEQVDGECDTISNIEIIFHGVEFFLLLSDNFHEIFAILRKKMCDEIRKKNEMSDEFWVKSPPISDVNLSFYHQKSKIKVKSVFFPCNWCVADDDNSSLIAHVRELITWREKKSRFPLNCKTSPIVSIYMYPDDDERRQMTHLKNSWIRRSIRTQKWSTERWWRTEKNIIIESRLKRTKSPQSCGRSLISLTAGSALYFFIEWSRSSRSFIEIITNLFSCEIFYFFLDVVALLPSYLSCSRRICLLFSDKKRENTAEQLHWENINILFSLFIDAPSKIKHVRRLLTRSFIIFHIERAWQKKHKFTMKRNSTDKTVDD